MASVSDLVSDIPKLYDVRAMDGNKKRETTRISACTLNVVSFFPQSYFSQVLLSVQMTVWVLHAVTFTY